MGRRLEEDPGIRGVRNEDPLDVARKTKVTATHNLLDASKPCA